MEPFRRMTWGPGCLGHSRPARVAATLSVLSVLPAAWALLALWTPRSSSAAVQNFGLDPSASRALARAGEYMQTQRTGEGFAVLDSLLRVAAARGDARLRVAALIAKGGRLSWIGQERNAEPILREALSQAEALHERALYVRAAMWLDGCLLGLGRVEEAAQFAQTALPAVTQVGDAEAEGYLRLSLAYNDLMSGRAPAALRGYQIARKLLHEAGNRFEEIDALTGMGRAHTQMGEPDLARACFEQVLELSRRYGRKENEADALNNLGSNEYTRGDPAAALVMLQEALRIRRALGNPQTMITPAVNATKALTDLGRFEEAAALLDSLLTRCREGAYEDEEASVTQALAELRERQGATNEALRLEREILNLPFRPSIARQSEALLGSATALLALDSTAAALAVMDGPARAIRASLSAELLPSHDLVLARCLLRSDRPAEALAAARQAAGEAEKVGLVQVAIEALTLAGRTEFRAGDTGRALDDLNRAVRLWEEDRARPTDPEWREHLASRQELLATLIEVLARQPHAGPDDPGVRAAFNQAQRFKSRTLLERMGAVTPAAVLDTLQQRVLGDGELLLDFCVGAEHSYLFRVTRNGCRLSELPGAAELAEKIDLYGDLLRKPRSAPSAQLDRAAASVEQMLLGDISEEVKPARRIFYVPDGPLYRLPLHLLRLPGQAEWLGLRTVISRIPSAAFLSESRMRRTTAARAEPFRGLALAGLPAPGGRALEGAHLEVRRLGGYQGIELSLPESDSTVDAAVRRLGSYDLLHFAAHTDLDDQHPWRSSVLLQSPDKASATWRLHAEEIAALSLRARLVVLSGCESAGGRVVEGEGLQGLSTAFLTAKAGTILATLWPVEDRATASLMSCFYRKLADGLPAGEALRQAARELSGARGTSDPFYWGGVILIGDPDQSIPLVKRRFEGNPARLSLAAALLLLSLAGWKFVIPGLRRRLT